MRLISQRGPFLVLLPFVLSALGILVARLRLDKFYPTKANNTKQNKITIKGQTTSSVRHETTNSTHDDEIESFLIFAKRRSGSYYLRSLLNKNPEISCGSEALSGVKDLFWNLTMDEYLQMVFDAMAKQADKAKKRGRTKAGFKIMYNQGLLGYNGYELFMALSNKGYKAIHLVRRNKLLQYISWASYVLHKEARMMGLWNGSSIAHPTSAADAQRLNNSSRLVGKDISWASYVEHKEAKMMGLWNGSIAHPTSAADAQRLNNSSKLVGTGHKQVLDHMRRVASEDADLAIWIAACFDMTQRHTIFYEDLDQNPHQEMFRLYQFLGAKQVQDIRSSLVKIHQGIPAREYFAEEDQEGIKEALQKSEFAWVLENW